MNNRKKKKQEKQAKLQNQVSAEIPKKSLFEETMNKMGFFKIEKKEKIKASDFRESLNFIESVQNEQPVLRAKSYKGLMFFL